MPPTPRPARRPPGAAPSPRTTLRRRPDRGSHAPGVIRAVLDEASVCHVGFVADGYPVVVPTTYVRVGERLYLHGARANRALRHLVEGVEACLTVTILDGLVLARSAFHHSMNYRSVMVFGRVSEVTDPQEKLTAMNALLDHLAPGRSLEARPPSPEELARTLVGRLELGEASAKIREGGPVEEADDLTLAVWAGQVPLRLVPGDPIPDDGLPPGVTEPPSVAAVSSGARRAAW